MTIPKTNKNQRQTPAQILSASANRTASIKPCRRSVRKRFAALAYFTLFRSCSSLIVISSCRSYKYRGGEAFAAPPRIYPQISTHVLYSPPLPQHYGNRANRLGSRHGNSTPPRIAPSRPHCDALWPGGSIIVGGADHGADGIPFPSRCDMFAARAFTGSLGAYHGIASPSSGLPPLTYLCDWI
jgi:hypothetical protein